MIIILQKQIFCRVAFFCVLASFILFQSLLAEPLKLENPIEPFQINPILNPFAVVKSHGTKPSKIKIEFTGAKSFSSAELRTALAEPIQEISRLDLTSASADDLAFFLGIFYRKNGFPDADIKWKITEINGLTLTISEGQRVGIGDINFIGNIVTDRILASRNLSQHFFLITCGDCCLGMGSFNIPRVRSSRVDVCHPLLICYLRFIVD